MKWTRFDDKSVPIPMYEQLLIILEMVMPNTSSGMNYMYYISTGEMTLENGIRVDALVGRKSSPFISEPFMWAPMINLPFEKCQVEKLSSLKSLEGK